MNQTREPFIARQEEIEEFTRTLLGPNPRPAFYVSGPPGAGKTFFSWRLFNFLQKLAKESNGKIAAVYLPSLHSFPVTAAQWMQTVLAEAPNRQATGTGAKRMVVVVDDFDRLLFSQLGKNEAAKLREELDDWPDILLVALGTTDALERLECDDAWKGFFSGFFLGPLTDEACQELFRSFSDCELSCDMPRLLALASGRMPGNVLACAESVSDDPIQWIECMAARFRPFYKATWEALPPLERRVLNSLCQWRGPVASATLSSECGITVNEASALLNRLLGRGLLALERRGRANLYTVSDRAFLLCRAFSAFPASRKSLAAFFSFCAEIYRQGLAARTVILKQEATKGPQDRSPGYWPVFPGPCESIKEAPEEMDEPQPEPSINDLLLPVPDFSAALAQEGFRSTIDPEDFLAEAAGKNPDAPPAWEIYAGFLHRVRRKEVKAEEAYLKALELDANRQSLWMGLGLLLQDSPEREVEAEQAFRIAVSLAPDDPCAHALVGRFFSRDPERQALAEGELRRAVEIKPDFGAAWAALSELLVKNPEQRDEARRISKGAEESLGREIREFKKATGLTRARQKAEREQKANLAQEACGLLLQGGEHLLAAAAAFERLARLCPEDAWPWAMQGYCFLVSKGEGVRCRAALAKATGLAPANALAVACMGELCFCEGKKDEAFSFFENAAKEPDAGGLVFARLGELAAEKGHPGQAEEFFRRAIGLEPDEPWAYAHLGRLLLSAPERLADAKKALGRAVSLCPDYALAHLWYAQALEAAGEPDQAFARLQDAVMADPESFGAWEALIVFSMEKLKDRKAALDFARQYLERANDKTAARKNIEQTCVSHGFSGFLSDLGPDPPGKEAFRALEKGPPPLAQALEKAARGDFSGAFYLVAPLFAKTGQARGFFHAMAGLLLAAAKAGHGEDCLAALGSVPETEATATIACAVRIIMGKEPGLLPLEMILVARDLAGFT